MNVDQDPTDLDATIAECLTDPVVHAAYEKRNAERRMESRVLDELRNGRRLASDEMRRRVRASTVLPVINDPDLLDEIEGTLQRLAERRLVTRDETWHWRAIGNPPVDILVIAMAKRCGLQHPANIEAQAIAYGDRKPGRTTAMLLEALVMLDIGCEVRIVAKTPAQADEMSAEILGLASRAGIDRGTLRYGLSMAVAGQPMAQRALDAVLFDHSIPLAERFSVDVSVGPWSRYAQP